LAVDSLSPGFAGLFVGDDDQLQVLLVESTKLQAVESAILAVFGGLPGKRERGSRALPARYSFRMLNNWLEKILGQADIPGLLLADIDERRNHLYLGVRDVSSLARLRDVIGALGVPANAVRIERVEPPKQTQAPTLSSIIRPVVGGLRMTAAGSPGCTLGFNATLPSDPGGMYFVTNAHCALPWGSVTGATASQPLFVAGAEIGYEVVDPPFAAMPGEPLCPTGVLCRWSDAALFKYYSGVSTSWKIARTEYPARSYQHPGSLTIAQPPEWGDVAYEFYVYNELPAWQYAVGQYIDKVGYTTGWTGGKIAQTCLTIFNGGTRLLCQYSVDDYYSVGADLVGGGDSGSPAFMLHTTDSDPPITNVWIAGVVHSMTPNPYKFYFSPISGVKADLGPLKVYPGPTCTPVYPSIWC
jgi:hypothetical protein